MKLHFLLPILIFLASCSKEPPKFSYKAPVEVKAVEQKTVPIWLETVGNAVANLTVEVTPQVTGMVQEVHAKEGQKVKEGDLLYVIDPKPYEAQVKIAQGTLEQDLANLAYQKINLERHSKLISKDYISKLQIEEIETQIASLEAKIKEDEGRLEIAKINLNYCWVKSPIDGKVGQHHIHLGNVVTANSSDYLTVIKQLNPIQVQFTFSQKELGEILNQGQVGDLPFECYLYQDKKTPYKGSVYFSDNRINPNTGTILFKGIYPNQNDELFPGAFLRVKMFLRHVENGLLIPVSAVQKGQKGSSVFVVGDDLKAELRSIKLGPQVGDEYVVESGLKSGEKVVTLGQLNLRNGMPVEIKG